MNYYLWAVLFLAISVAETATAQKIPISSRYKQEFYYLGNGKGATEAEALSQAQAVIAQQIEVSIVSEIVSSLRSVVVDNKEQIESDFHSTAKTVANASLQGIEIIESKKEKGEHHVFCILDKEKFRSKLDLDLNNSASALESTFENARKLVSQGNVFAGLDMMLGAMDDVNKFHSQSSLYASITGRAWQGSENVPNLSVYSDIKLILNQIRINKISGDNQEAVIGTKLPKPFVVNVSYSPDGITNIVMPNVRLEARSADGKNVELGETESNGNASFYYSAVGKGVEKVNIKMNPRRLPRYYLDELRRQSVDFTYTVNEPAKMDFHVEIINEGGTANHTLSAVVSKSVTGAGYTVKKDARYVITGMVRTLDYRQVSGLTGVQHSVKVEMNLRIKDNVKGKYIGSLTLSEIGTDKVNRQKAEESAQRKLSPTVNQIAKFIAEAYSDLE